MHRILRYASGPFHTAQSCGCACRLGVVATGLSSLGSCVQYIGLSSPWASFIGRLCSVYWVALTFSVSGGHLDCARFRTFVKLILYSLGGKCSCPQLLCDWQMWIFFFKRRRQNSSAKMVFYTHDYSSHTGDHLLCSLSPTLANKRFVISSILRGMSRWCLDVSRWPCLYFPRGQAECPMTFSSVYLAHFLSSSHPFFETGFLPWTRWEAGMASALRCWVYRPVSPYLFGSLSSCFWAWRIVCRL